MAAVAGSILVGVAATQVPGEGSVASAEPGQGLPGPAAFEYAQQRIVKARVLHLGKPTVRHANARRVGRWLASLRPTWVSGLFRYRAVQRPRASQIRKWDEIRRIVRAADPRAQFDVTLNADQYRNGQHLQRTMSAIRAALGNNGWFFDFYSTAYRKRPRMIRAAIESAHAHGEFIGGNVFGLARPRRLPLRSDFLAVQDFRLRLNLRAVSRLSNEATIVYHLHNHPDHEGKGGCRFIEDWTPHRRRAHVRNRARQQLRFGFRFQYPVLFPACRRTTPTGREILYSYNAFRDPPMSTTISRLLDRYDSPPPAAGGAAPAGGTPILPGLPGG